jgi:uncharacterized membrane protein YfcA
LRILLLLGAAFAAGVVNSIAGGGTLLTFPSLIAAGLSPLAANATSTVALVPGSLGSFWGYRKEVFAGDDRRMLVALAVPSLAGGIAGALLVVRAGDALFARLVPWLIFAATALFVANDWILSRARAHPARTEHRHGPYYVAAFQLVVAVYGGFFGAGMGILMLAAMGLAGVGDIHRMNGLKNLAAICINGTASVTFALERRVVWRLSAMMAGAAIVGGYVGARAAKRVGQQFVRRAIAAIGFGIAGWLAYRSWR